MEKFTYSRDELDEAVRREQRKTHRPTDPIIWSLPYNADCDRHFVTRADSDRTKVSYYESEEKLVRGIRTVIKPGRYLKRFYPSLTDDEITTRVDQFVAPPLSIHKIEPCPADADEAKIAELQEGWVWVYANGPHSCMKGEPAVKYYVYPGNGLGLAYAVDKDGNIKARAIYSDLKKGYIRVYGSHPHFITLRETLEAEGYKELDSLADHKVALKIYKDDEDLPSWDDRAEFAYIDGRAKGLRHKGDHFVVVSTRSRPHYVARGHCGVTKPAISRVCPACHIKCKPRSLVKVDGRADPVCPDCASTQVEAVLTVAGRVGHRLKQDTVYCESDGRYYLNRKRLLKAKRLTPLDGKWYFAHELDQVIVGKERELVYG